MIKGKTILYLLSITIFLLFITSSYLAFNKFNSEYTSAQLANQVKMIELVNESLSLYFSKLEFITNNTILHESFKFVNSKPEDSIRFQVLTDERLILNHINDDDVINYLKSPKASVNLSMAEPIPDSLNYWQLYKGLPEKDHTGKMVADSRRQIMRNILRTFPDIHYVFEMDANGDLVMLEPFEIQKNITSFNYDFRDYLKTVKKQKATSLSEGYISHDQDRTQIITVAAPIFDESNKLSKIFAASISSSKLVEKVFRPLKMSISSQNLGTKFYLVDRHGHIVASSTGKNIYRPIDGMENDEQDPGNLRNIGYFKNISWLNDILEEGNDWERATKSWDESTIDSEYSGEYINLDNEMVISTFKPTNLINTGGIYWGILIETPKDKLLASNRYIINIFVIIGILSLAVLLILVFFVMKTYDRLMKDIHEQEESVKQVARKVAHDMGGPISVLSLVISQLSQIPKEQRDIIKKALNQISRISNQILDDYRMNRFKDKNKIDYITSSLTTSKIPKEKISTRRHNALDLLIGAVKEKAYQYQYLEQILIEYQIGPESYGLFFEVNAQEFKSIISNLIDNSIESFVNDSGKIIASIGVDVTHEKIIIEVMDNGSGIPKSILENLMYEVKSYNKPQGTGIGLLNARVSVESWGGNMQINSTLGSGTTLSISLPRADEYPKWFIPLLTIEKLSTVVIVNNENEIFKLWKERIMLNNQNTNDIKLLYFPDALKFKAWFKEDFHLSEDKKLLYIVDQDLGTISSRKLKLNGMDIVQEFSIEKECIILTDLIDQKFLTERAERLKVKLLPKNLIQHIPIQIK